MSRLILDDETEAQMIAHCLRAYPDEGCGLLAGDLATGRVLRCYAMRNAAESSRLYAIDSIDLLHADKDAESSGATLFGVFHSHTHTDPYPSPTDVDQAPDPSWHYVIISLRHEVPTMRSYRIAARNIEEEPIERDV